MSIDDESAAPARIGERIGRRNGGEILRRWFGAWVDFLGAALFGALLGFGAVVLGASDMVTGFTAIAGTLIYFWVLEAVWGRTLGKLVTGLVVVDAVGNPPGFGKAGIRTLLRLIEVNPFLLGGIPAGLVAANSKAGQRIGDMLAKTYVVPLRALKAARAAPAPELFG